MEKGRLKIYAHLSALISFLLPHIFSFWGEGGGGLDNTSNFTNFNNVAMMLIVAVKINFFPEDFFSSILEDSISR